MVHSCESFQETRANPPKVRIHCWEKPQGPFQRVHVGYAGPFMGILVDTFSKWPEVRMEDNTTTETTTNLCRDILSIFGVPMVLESDNGTQFASMEFARAPYHPATNGTAERFIQFILDDKYAPASTS